MNTPERGQVYIAASTGQRWRVADIDRQRAHLAAPDGRAEWVHHNHLHPTGHDSAGLPHRTGYVLRTWDEPDFDQRWEGQ